MAQIYGELIRAQLQISASDLSSPAAGLVYFNSTDGVKWYNGSDWKTAVDLNSTQTLQAKTIGTTCIVSLMALPTIPYSKLNLADGDIPQAKVFGLVTDLAGKVAGNAAITGATKTKITYDSKGLVTAGADLAAGDLPTGIDATKISSGGVTNTKFDKLSTAGSNGPDLLVNTDGTQNLWNKTLIECKVDNFSDFAEETSSQVAPGSGYLRVYAKNNHKLYKIWDGGTETEIGSGGSGTGRNYLQDWYDGNQTITVSGTTLGATANRTTDTTLWARSTVAGLTIQNNSVSPLRQAGDFLVNSSATTINSFVESPLWTLDVADLGKPVSIEFDIMGIDASTSYDVVVVRYNNSGTYQEIISVAGNASTGTPASAQLPTGTVKFRGFYVPSSTSNDQYALRLRKVAAVDDDFQIDSLFVGPQSLAQASIVTAWQSFTPTGTWTSNTTYTGKYRRVGDSAQIQILLSLSGAPNAASLTVNMPTGMTIDTNKMIFNGSTAAHRVIGDKVTIRSAGVSYEGQIIYDTTTVIDIYFLKTASGTNPVAINTGNIVNATSPGTFASGDLVLIDFTVPVVEWSSGTTTLADRAVEEYASNSDASVSSNPSSFAYGPAGSPVPNGTAVAGFTKRVQFLSTIQATDSLVLELQQSPGNPWIPVANSLAAGNTSCPYIYENGATYGMGLTQVNSTQVDVNFGRYSQHNVTTFGGAGAAWSDVYNGGNLKWRVRKVSSGAAVGFPVSARNIVGDTSGTAVPSGYVGELKETTISTGAITAETEVGSITLTTGVWLVNGTLNGNSGAGAVVVTAKWRIKGNDGGIQGKDIILNTQVSTERGVTNLPPRVIVVADSDADKTIKIRASNSISQTFAGYMSAVRIA